MQRFVKYCGSMSANKPQYSVWVGEDVANRLTFLSDHAPHRLLSNAEFIELVKAQHVVLVHGEHNNMGRLRAAMSARYKDRDDVKIHTRNLETLGFSFRGERTFFSHVSTETHEIICTVTHNTRTPTS
ncbi:hypothetical protein AB1N83_003791 [Pleurotus pulmonarius]